MCGLVLTINGPYATAGANVDDLLRRGANVREPELAISQLGHPVMLECLNLLLEMVIGPRVAAAFVAVVSSPIGELEAVHAGRHGR